MNRYCLVILFALITSILARTVGNQPSKEDSNECSQTQIINDSDEISNTDIQPTVATTEMITVDHDGNGNIENVVTKLPFRKRRASNMFRTIAESAESREEEGSGENDLPTSGSKEVDKHQLDSSGNVSNVSNATSDHDGEDASKSAEMGSGENTTKEEVANLVNSNTIDGSDRITVLKSKVKSWQQAVDNYLHAGQRRRRRRETEWSRIFSPATSSNGFNSGKSNQASNTIASAAGNAVSGALKPAMQLMNQGVDLLSDLYSAQLIKSPPMVPSIQRDANNSTVSDDQFRDQLKELQRKLGDLGNQLQQVVSSFQRMQVPILDKFLSGGGTPLPTPKLVSDHVDGKKLNAKAKNDDKI